MPRLLNASDTRGVNRLVSSVLALRVSAAVVALAAVLIAARKFPDWFNVAPGMEQSSRLVVLVVGLATVSILPLSVFRGVLASLQRYDLIAGFDVLFSLAWGAGVLVLLATGRGLVDLAILSFSVEVGIGFLLVAVAMRLCRGLQPSVAHVDRTLFPDLLGYSTSTVMWATGQVLTLQTGKTLVGLLYGTAAATDFAIPFMLLVMVGNVVSQGTIVVKPAVSSWHAEGQHDRIRDVFLAGTKYGLMIAVPAAAACILHAENLLRAWVGNEASSRSAVALAIMAIPQMLRLVQLSGYFVMTALGKHRLYGVVAVCQSLTGLALAYVLAETAGLGLLGVAIGVSVPQLIASGVILPIHCSRSLELPLARQFAHCWIPALRAAIPFVLYLSVIRLTVTIETRLEFLALFAIAGLLLLLGIWFGGLNPSERQSFRSYLPFTAGHRKTHPSASKGEL